MANQSQIIWREAKALQQVLKESLKAHEPWHRDTEYERKSLRRQYLQLLLVHPYSPESQDAETHLWMQTSYNFIASYKQRVALIEKAIEIDPTENTRKHPSPGVVEHRKLVGRFRQFLAEEDKFWSQLLLRLYRSFALAEAESALNELGILPISRDTSQAAEEIDLGRQSNQFPPVNASPRPNKNDASRRSHLEIVSKALICLGDIARYRELYKENSGRNRAAGPDGAATSGRNGRRRWLRRGGLTQQDLDMTLSKKNFDRAYHCYEQAKRLVPELGNASHQLAILASYEKDTFGSLTHYYRALCVREPYETAVENLGTILHKALEQFKTRLKAERRGLADEGVAGATHEPVPPRIRVEKFKESILVLHALWKLGVDRIDTKSPKYAYGIVRDFGDLVSNRTLPTDTVTTAVVLSQAAVWKNRMLRDTDKNRNATGASAATIEANTFQHVLAIHRTLLECGLLEMTDASISGSKPSDLAQLISATFRRTLPALRVASKWLRANLQYVQKMSKAGPHIVFEAGELEAFWTAYVNFSVKLLEKFPPGKLPQVIMPLEEDGELRGFLPLRQLLLESMKADDGKAKPVHSPTQVHPNEEQLMRISDLISDAYKLAHSPSGPPELHVLIPQADSHGPAMSRGQTPFSDPYMCEGDEMMTRGNTADEMTGVRADDATTTSSRTDDDPVGDAFRQALDGSASETEDMQEDDEIVWNPRYRSGSVSPNSNPPSRGYPSPAFHAANITPIKAGMSPSLSAAAQTFASMGPSTFNPPAVNRMASTTAQDLFNTFMGTPKAGNGRAHPHENTTPVQPQLLFGSGADTSSGQSSIWSMSRDQPMDVDYCAPPTYSSHRRQKSMSPPSRLIQPAWAFSAANEAQPPQQAVWPPVKRDAYQWGT